MVAIRICPWCNTVWDAIVGVDGIYCSPSCKAQAFAEKQSADGEDVRISQETANGEYFDDFPGLSEDEFEEAIARLRQSRRRPKWQ